MCYRSDFISGAHVNMPAIVAGHPSVKDTVLLDYQHFSMIYSRGRRQPVCTAVNIDGKCFVEIKQKDSSGTWRYEDKIAREEQIGQEFYSLTNQDFHKGHIVRRMDPCWGTDQEARSAEDSTFHFTNASPQHREFNPRIWLELERNILEKGAVQFDERLSVLAGPVLSPADKSYIKKVRNEQIFIPSSFWKIIVWQKVDGRVCAVGFMQSQLGLILRYLNLGKDRDRGRKELDDHFGNLSFKGDAVYQVKISDIEKVTGLSFDFTGMHLPAVKEGKGELTKGSEAVDQYKGAYRSSGEEIISIKGLVLD